MDIAGYIVQDCDGYAIAGMGATEEEARADALQYVGPWEDRDFNTVGPDHPEFGFDAKFTILPATAELLRIVQDSGGQIGWDVVDGIARPCNEQA
jgi:hypothetical protein